MGTLLRVIVKELLQLRQDRKMVPVLLVGPVVQLIVFGFAVNTDVRDVPLLLVDQDRTAESRRLVESFARSGYFEVVGVEDDVRPVEDWFERGRAQVALVIGRGYGRALAANGSPRVQVIVDGTDANGATVALGYAKGVMAAQDRLRARARVEALLAAHPGAVAPGRIQAIPRVWYNPDLRSRWFYVPAVLALILMTLTMLLSAMAVVREKEIGTLEQLMVTPIRPGSSWWKLAPFALIGFVQVFAVTAIAVWGFGVPLRGSFLLLLLLTQLFLLNTLGLGLLVSTLVETQQQAMMLTTFALMVPMIYLSGLIFPIENMPVAIQYVTYVIPVRYYALIIRGVFLRGSGIGVLWPPALVLGLMGLAILGLSTLRFRKRIG